ncbi:MAG: class I tRNA ligase family protein [Candidatus Sungbacteria bacterium]|nr:class I tRNA ligase family protein [Candidatus Sungbacteria bacterium]
MRYNPKQIEKKWQKVWLKKGVYEPDLKRAKKPFYNLMMFPYPSAEGLHIGSVRTFTGVDIYGRFKRMLGFDVFEPIGLDGFGIHSENYALKIGKHPMKLAKITEKNFYRQLAEIGNGFSWKEHFETYDQEYYKWTQWVFIQLFKRGLAYRKKQAVNWCPSCLTVLADEQVVSGECERCGAKVTKKELEQWFFRITKYAERLLNNIDGSPSTQNPTADADATGQASSGTKNLKGLDWSENIKIAQRNWIGRSEGAAIKFELIDVPGQPDKKHAVEIFTTRPDTLFGATFLVISPELAKFWLEIGWEAPEGIRNYIDEALKRRILEKRDRDGKDKTGIESGIFALNPANKEKIPVWISDYVLAGYGTGAIMAVPAHDERDFEFANKFGLPIKQVVAPYMVVDGTDAPRSSNNIVRFNAATVIIKHWAKDLYYVVDFSEHHRGLVGGHIEEGETSEQTALRETREESGYTDIKFISLVLEHAYSRGYKTRKSREEECHDSVFAIILGSEARVDIVDRETKKGQWKTKEDILNDAQFSNHHKEFFSLYIGHKPFTGSGVQVNSGKFDRMGSEEAKRAITEFVGGKRKIQYHLRDWLISRQRYWGPPIPMIFCEVCYGAGRGEQKEMPGWHTVPEQDLPVKLPFVKDFRPKGTGTSPLAEASIFSKVKCPACKKTARRETDVSDTFLDSAWYYLRYPSVNEKKAAWNKEITKKWLPVDMYIGGAEHSVLHLLYSRFIAMVFCDAKVLPFEEPFTTFRAHGLITKDGAKMSKSKGNVVSPDEYIRAYGADAVRMYLAFLAPLPEGGDFRDEGIRGITRFLDRVWKFTNEKIKIKNEKPQRKKKNEIQSAVHKTIKKVTGDVEALQYNTAISALMILLNKFEENTEEISSEDCKVFLKLLAPFAPHITEELYQSLKSKSYKLKAFSSIHSEPWPKFNAKFIHEETYELVVQVNGKIRDKFEVAQNVSEKEAVDLTLAREKVKLLLNSKPYKKIIFVPGRLVNIVL